MTIDKLINKHNYITDITRNDNGKYVITIFFNIKYVKDFFQQEYIFSTLAKCDLFLCKNYLRLKYELAELLLEERQIKINNQTVQLCELNKAYLKTVKQVERLIEDISIKKKGQLNPFN